MPFGGAQSGSWHEAAEVTNPPAEAGFAWLETGSDSGQSATMLVPASPASASSSFSGLEMTAV